MHCFPQASEYMGTIATLPLVTASLILDLFHHPQSHTERGRHKQRWHQEAIDDEGRPSRRHRAHRVSFFRGAPMPVPGAALRAALGVLPTGDVAHHRAQDCSACIWLSVDFPPSLHGFAM
jgi:hypothetical protein